MDGGTGYKPSVIIVKEAFGGTGMNILNVALTARVFIFFAYPTYISGDQVWIAGLPESPDAFSGATVLGVWAKQGYDAMSHVGFSTVSQQVGWHPDGYVPGFHSGIHRRDQQTGHSSGCRFPDMDRNR